MSVTEVQVTLPAPPTGMALVTALHEYNPLNGHYEPLVKLQTLNDEIAATVAGALLMTVPATVNRRDVYIIVLSNTGATGDSVTIADAAGTNTITIYVPGYQTIAIVSIPAAPIISFGPGNVNATSLATATVRVFVSSNDK